MSQYVATRFGGAATAPIIFPPSVPTPLLLKCDRSATVSVRIRGTPAPRVSWHVGSSKKPLLESAGYQQNVEKDEYSLTIASVTDELDEGLEILAVNLAGQDRFSISVKTFRLLSSHTPSSSPGLEQRSLHRSSHLRRSMSDSTKKAKTMKHTTSRSTSRTGSRALTPDDLLTWHKEMIQRTKEIRSVDDLNLNDQSDEEASIHGTTTSVPFIEQPVNLMMTQSVKPIITQSVNPMMTQSLSDPPTVETTRQSRPVVRSLSSPWTQPHQRFLETDLDSVEAEDLLPYVIDRREWPPPNPDIPLLRGKPPHSGKTSVNQNWTEFNHIINSNMCEEFVNRKQILNQSNGFTDTASEMRDSTGEKYKAVQGNYSGSVANDKLSDKYNQPAQVHRPSLNRNYSTGISRSDSLSKSVNDGVITFRPNSSVKQERYVSNSDIDTCRSQAATDNQAINPTDSVCNRSPTLAHDIRKPVPYRDVCGPNSSFRDDSASAERDVEVWTMFGLKLSEICCQLLSNFSFVAEKKCTQYKPVPQESELNADDSNNSSNNYGNNICISNSINNNNNNKISYIWGKDPYLEYRASSVKDVLQNDIYTTSDSNDYRQIGNFSSFHPIDKKIESSNCVVERYRTDISPKTIATKSERVPSGNTNDSGNTDVQSQNISISNHEMNGCVDEILYVEGAPEPEQLAYVSSELQPLITMDQGNAKLQEEDINVENATLKCPEANFITPEAAGSSEGAQTSADKDQFKTALPPQERPSVKFKPPVSKKPSISSKDIRHTVVINQVSANDRAEVVKPVRPHSASMTGVKKPPVPVKPVYLSHISSGKSSNTDKNLKQINNTGSECNGPMSYVSDSDLDKRTVMVEFNSSERLMKKSIKKPPLPPVESKGHMIVKMSSHNTSDSSNKFDKSVPSDVSSSKNNKKEHECRKNMSSIGSTFSRDERFFCKNGSLSPPPVYRERQSTGERMRGMSGSRSVEHLSSLNADPRLMKRSLSREWKVTTVTTREEITVVTPSSRQSSYALHRADVLQREHPNSSQDVAEKWNVITKDVGEMIGHLSQDVDCSYTLSQSLCSNPDPVISVTLTQSQCSNPDSMISVIHHSLTQSHCSIPDPMVSVIPTQSPFSNPVSVISVAPHFLTRSQSSYPDSMNHQCDKSHKSSLSQIDTSTAGDISECLNTHPSTDCGQRSDASCADYYHRSNAQHGQYGYGSGNGNTRFSDEAVSVAHENSRSSGKQFDDLIDSLLVIASSNDTIV